MQIYLSNSGQEPIYAQITRQIKQQILSGALRPALLREEHLKKVEDCLQGAVDAARLGGIGYDEVAETLRLLWEG